MLVKNSSIFNHPFHMFIIILKYHINKKIVFQEREIEISNKILYLQRIDIKDYD